MDIPFERTSFVIIRLTQLLYSTGIKFYSFWRQSLSREIMLKDGSLLTIRLAEASDAAEIIEYAETISSESDNLTFGPGEFGIGIEDERAFVEKINGGNNSIYLVGIIDGRIVGSIIFAGGTRPRTAHTGEMSMSVLKAHWGKGIGTALINALIIWAKGTGIVTKMNLNVRIDNKNGIGLYRKAGFIEVGKTSRDLCIMG
jgi:GNAT superfamily N-acetyltransferase